MQERYHITVSGHSLEVSVTRDEEGLLLAAADGRRWRAEPQTGTGATVQRVQICKLDSDGQASEPSGLIFAQRRTTDGLELALDGAVHAARVLDARAVRYSRLVKPPASARRSVVKAQMPGLVVTVSVSVGDVVECGQSLMTISAMKLENDIRSPVSGRVTAVHVQPNQAVERGVVLIELE